ncbi:hypothetical protein [uncultured Ruminococcus sp.]|uniref:hypothetical protein n=1 Tax=uncultured Ruminococcus sp. TaxID=165186 RepID=UPI0025D86E73|nr:hypothetical protein [uncultured Ruminococcus sp.]
MGFDRQNITAFLSANIWLMFKGASKGAAGFYAVIAVYFIRPLTVKKFRAVYRGVSEVFVLTTFLLRGIIIVDPIWTWR